MANRIVHALKRFAVSTAIRFTPVSQFSMADPEPRLRAADDVFSRDASFDWMFDNAESAISPAVRALSGELSRVSTALCELREILACLVRVAPLHKVEVNEIAAPNFRWAEDVLFDGHVPPIGNVIPVAAAGHAAFLFEDDKPVENWGVLRPSLAEFAHPL